MPSPKIFVVEDEAIVAMDLRQRLVSMNFEITGTAATGADALERVRSGRPDIILMDIQIKGDIDGIETSVEIRKLYDVPIIFLTANSDIATIERAKTAGPLAYLLKPFEDRELQTAIEIALYRHELEQRLKRSELWLSTTLRSIGDGVVATDCSGRITFMNPLAELLTGWTVSDAQGQEAREVFKIYREHDDDIFDPVGEVLRRQATIALPSHCLLIRKNGERIAIDDSVALVENDNGDYMGVVLVFRDITARRMLEKENERYRTRLEELVRKRTEALARIHEELKYEFEEHRRLEAERHSLREQLERAERMRSLGLLAGGVAHDLNNTLGPLVGYPDMLLAQLPPDSQLRKPIERIARAAEDAASTVQDLLSLARRGRYEMSAISLNDVVISFLDSPVFINLRKKHPGVAVKTRLCEAGDWMMGSKHHLSKVVMNMVVNAYDAMPSGGELTISTVQRQYDSLPGGYANIKPGTYMSLHIKDTGTGIAEDDLEKIFEPYYSKKELGTSGSGLGLAVVYGIVKDHHGYYDVFSEKGRGSEFVMYFPTTSPEITESSDQVETVHGTETVLVVDDVEEQRDLAQAILASQGYSVTTAASGTEAIHYVSKNPVDILILDMILDNGLDGLDTYRAIIQINPGQKAIIISGYSSSERVKTAIELGVGAYIQKPYRPDVLILAVRNELDREPAIGVR